MERGKQDALPPRSFLAIACEGWQRRTDAEVAGCGRRGGAACTISSSWVPAAAAAAVPAAAAAASSPSAARPAATAAAAAGAALLCSCPHHLSFSTTTVTSSVLQEAGKSQGRHCAHSASPSSDPSAFKPLVPSLRGNTGTCTTDQHAGCQSTVGWR